MGCSLRVEHDGGSAGAVGAAQRSASPDASPGTTVSSTNAGSTRKTSGKSRRTGHAAGVHLGATTQRGALLAARRASAGATGAPRRSDTSSASATGRSRGTAATASSSACSNGAPERARAAHASAGRRDDRRSPPRGRLDREERRAPGIDRDAEQVERDRQLPRDRGVDGAGPAAAREVAADRRLPGPP